jgi:uncharacterized protein YndB with AHSA1/START domain
MTATDSKPFVISRTFNAPRDLVWKAWTESEHMQWWGSKCATITHAKMDFRPGGIFHYCMRTPDGKEMWGKWAIREIVKPNKLVFINSFSDKDAGLTRHPMSPGWPLEVLSTMTFEEINGQTLLTITWQPWLATSDEQKTFDAAHEGMTSGWCGSLDQLEAHLTQATVRK